MEYPLQVELNVNQDDFIQVEILEQTLEMELWKQETRKAFIIESAVMAVVACLVCYFAAKGVIVYQSLIFVAGIWIIFRINAGYTYFFGAKREFNMAVQHLLMNKDENEFFTPERGMVLFFEDRCEYLSNEQRRFFSYEHIKHVKTTRHLYIFVMKRTKEKNLKGFAYMVLPKRNLSDDEREKMDIICNNIVNKYDLKPWVESSILN